MDDATKREALALLQDVRAELIRGSEARAAAANLAAIQSDMLGTIRREYNTLLAVLAEGAEAARVDGADDLAGALDAARHASVARAAAAICPDPATMN